MSVVDERPSGEEIDEQKTINESKSQEGTQPAALSKNQQKKLAKREKWLARRPILRKEEKEKRKAKRKMAAVERTTLGLERPEYHKTKHMSDSDNRFRVVIDMDYDEFMTEQELAAAVKQLGRIYSLNRHAVNPCQLYFTSLSGRLAERCAISNTGYTNWDCNISELDYLSLFRTDQHNSKDGEESFLKQFVYLTGDSDEDLPDVSEILKDESRIFIIGGLVDHNRHKMLCYTKAVKKRIQTARLPIAKYIKLSQRSILSTVAVFEIMLRVLGSHKSWPDALLEGIPKRMIAHPIVNVETNNPAKPIELKKELID